MRENGYTTCGGFAFFLTSVRRKKPMTRNGIEMNDKIKGVVDPIKDRRLPEGVQYSGINGASGSCCLEDLRTHAATVRLPAHKFLLSVDPE